MDVAESAEDGEGVAGAGQQPPLPQMPLQQPQPAGVQPGEMDVNVGGQVNQVLANKFQNIVLLGNSESLSSLVFIIIALQKWLTSQRIFSSITRLNLIHDHLCFIVNSRI